MEPLNRYQRPAGYDRCEVCVRCRRLTRRERKRWADGVFRWCEARGLVVDARAKVDDPCSATYRCKSYERRIR